MNDPKNKTSETRLLLKQREADLVRYQARLEGHRRELEAAVTRVVDNIKTLLKNGT